MFVRQFFDTHSSTYTYLIMDRQTQMAALIDPVAEKTDFYLQTLRELNLDLQLVLDTHTHADHISANGRLRERSQCQTVMGAQSLATCVDRHVRDGDRIALGSVAIEAIYTPGHTDDSYTYCIQSERQAYLFTGDTLLIRGSGRTDFQNGDAFEQYHSLFEKLLRFPEETLVYPGHDYQGRSVSTIGEEIRHNPRLQVADAEAYAEIMNNLNLPNPKMMDVAVPANQACGRV